MTTDNADEAGRAGGRTDERAGSQRADGPASAVTTDYDAVVFDNDGVLVELTDRDLLTDAVQAAFAAFDVDVDRQRARETVAADAVPTDLAREFGLDPERLWERREREAARVQREAVRTGAKSLYGDVSAIERLDARLGLVSNNQHETVRFIVDHHGLEWFETVYGREPTLAGARRKKPDPSYIRQALTDLDAESALYVGDSEKDVVAAQRAGIDSAFLRRAHRSDLRLSTEPTHEVADLHELVAALEA